MESHEYEEIARLDFDLDENWEALEKEILFVEEKKHKEIKRKVGKGLKILLKIASLLFLKNTKEVYQYYLEKFSLKQYADFSFTTKDLP